MTAAQPIPKVILFYLLVVIVTCFVAGVSYGLDYLQPPLEIRYVQPVEPFRRSTPTPLPLFFSFKEM